MEIINTSEISYIVNGTLVDSSSNTSVTKRIEPIIYFTKCVNECLIKVVIKNNSGTIIKNVLYKECLDKDLYVKGTLKINNKSFDYNPFYSICLKNIANNEIIKIEYKIKKNYYNNKSLLRYNFVLNNGYQTTYILSS